jgi:hypothetical protein
MDGRSRCMSGGLPDFLVLAIGTILIIDAVHLHAVSAMWVCLFANITFSLGVMSWLSLICRSLSEASRKTINIASCSALLFFMLSFPAALGYFDWLIHSIVVVVSLRFAYMDSTHEPQSG